MRRLLAFLAFFYCCASYAQVQDAWYGRYVFIDSGMNATGTRSWVYEDSLDIRPDGDKILAVYNAAENADGFDHLAQRWIGQKRGHQIVFTFDRCLPRASETSDHDQPDEDCADQHQRGTPMLTLAEKRGKNGKRVVLTYFHAFKPHLEKVPAGGVTYFRKVVAD